MDKNSKIYVAGHRGLAGSAILLKLKEEGYTNTLTRTSAELDLRNRAAVDNFFASEKPEYVFMAAGMVGGIYGSSQHQVEWTSYNLQMSLNVIDLAYKHCVKKLLYLGSSCIYPKDAPQPMAEESLLTGLLESTVEGYALAKIVAVRLCAYYKERGSNFISIMPSNLYGPRDNFDLLYSHVVAAIMRKCHEAKISGKDVVEIWGTGSQIRELTFIDDFADACLFLMKNYDGVSHINAGSNEEVTIKELAYFIKETTGFLGDFRFDTSKPDGMRRKVVDASKLHALGWNPKNNLKTGLAKMYDWFLKNQAELTTRTPREYKEHN